MAAMMMGAANLAYRKAVVGTREKTLTNPHAPAWLKVFAEGLPDDNAEAASAPVQESSHHHKTRVYKNSDIAYNRFAYKVYENVTSKAWFETFVMVNILLVGVATGLDLENAGRDPWAVTFVDVVGIETLAVFTIECILKIIAEGTEPLRYFTDNQNGYFNTFDFVIVLASLVFVDSSNAGAISALRMLRLVRLLTFVKGAPVLRVIVIGLIQGLKSVFYIVILLLLVIYIFAILGTLLFGLNDPAHFGSVSISMLSLFQVSTLASWTSIAYVSWYGCENYTGSPYAGAPHTNPSSIHTMAGTFEGFKCDSTDSAQPLITGLFFAFYILSTAWVIMTLFIGVISMGMFAAFLDMKQNQSAENAIASKARNLEIETPKHPEPHLKKLIDQAFDDVLFQKVQNTSVRGRQFEAVTDKAKEIRDSSWFTTFVALTIGVVGIKISIDTDAAQACLRLESRTQDRIWDSNNENLHDEVKSCEKHNGESGASVVVDIMAQIVFTFEMTIKLCAQGSKPLRYFTDLEEGSWNCLDFIIVAVGFIEMTPAVVAFQYFPVVLLRLLRLIRVFRLAKTLPRLRAIVEALISGFSAVGWICCLIVTFNYIAACMSMLIFQENDPFHFGSLGRSMFSVQRISTLDSWDQIMYIAVYGCDGYPGGYDFTMTKIHCNNPKAFGWLGVFILVIIVLLGAYILPTVLVGIISIKFDEASRYGETAKTVKLRTEAVVTQVQGEISGFFTEGRMEVLKELFNSMDCHQSQSLEILEITPYFHYVFDKYFGVLMRASPAEPGVAEDTRIFHDRSEALFQIMDTTKSGNVSFDEFVRFTSIIKKMMRRCSSDSLYGLELFGPSFKNSKDPAWLENSWNRAITNVDYEATEQAWDAILLAVAGKEDSKAMDVSRASIESQEFLGVYSQDAVELLFRDFNSDGSATLDTEEFADGLKSIGVLITERQLSSILSTIDASGDNKITFEELNTAICNVRTSREELKIGNARREAQNMISQANAKDDLRNKGTSIATSRQVTPGRLKSSITSVRSPPPTGTHSRPVKISEVFDELDQGLQGRIEALGFSSVEAMTSFLEAERAGAASIASNTKSSSSISISAKGRAPTPSKFANPVHVGTKVPKGFSSPKPTPKSTSKEASNPEMV